jgi:integrase
VSLFIKIMTEKKTMAKLPGLFQRDGSYHLRVVVPNDLRPSYDKTTIRQSLGTASAREAALRGATKRAELLAEFAQKRRELSPQALDEVTPEMAAQLAQRVRAGVLRADDILREDPALVLLWVDAVKRTTNPLYALTIESRLPRITRAQLSGIDGLSRAEAGALAEADTLLNDEAGERLRARQLASMLGVVQGEARKLGFTFEATAPGAKEALQAALVAYRRAWQDISERDAGGIVETPEAPEGPSKAPVKPLRLRDVFDRWKEAKARSKDSIDACGRAVALYEEQTGNPLLSQLTRAQGDAFRAFLLKQPITSKTARDRLTWVKSVLKYAYRDLEAIPRNPWEGLDIASSTTNKRRPWSDEELRKLFSQPLHKEHRLPDPAKEWRAGGEAAYWIPLLGLYTGARVGELAQLLAKDVDTGSIPMLSITNEAEGQTVKTAAGIRSVPIHGELVRLGFLDYVAAMQKRGAVSLWPDLKQRAGKPGAYFSDWFGKYRASLGFGKQPDFHSFRHTVRSALAEAGIEEALIDALVGHVAKGSTGTKVYTHRSKQALQRAIEQLQFANAGVKP